MQEVNKEETYSETFYVKEIADSLTTGKLWLQIDEFALFLSEEDIMHLFLSEEGEMEKSVSLLVSMVKTDVPF